MSKLYTEEEVRRILSFCDEMTMDEWLKDMTPIELPTDEEIYELAKEQYPISMEKFGNEMMDGNIHFRSIFIQGAEWMRDKIGGKDD